jgi:CheY-like chemotaxis protein
MTKILVIEDDEYLRENLLEILKAEGFEAIAAEDGQTGINLAIQEVPDLILCDVMMPEVDGYEVLRLARQNPNTAMVPFVFLTSKATKADFRQGMELGAD